LHFDKPMAARASALACLYPNPRRCVMNDLLSLLLDADVWHGFGLVLALVLFAGLALLLVLSLVIIAVPGM